MDPKISTTNRIILPDEEKVTEEHFDELMAEKVEDDAGDDEEEEDKYDVRKHKQSLQSDVDREDFFEAKEKEPAFGDITGMSEDDEKPESKTSELTSGVEIEEQKTVEEEVAHEAEESPPDIAEELRRASTITAVSNFSEYRRSEMRKRTSIYYDITGRIDTNDTEDLEELFDLDKGDEIVLLDDYSETVEEESVLTEVEEQQPFLNRDLYYETYANISEQLSKSRIKNNILQKLVIMYLKRRKVDNIIKEMEPPLDQTLKYGQKLDTFEQLLAINKNERDAASSEVDELRQKRNTKNEQLNKQFKNMQSREENIGYGLIYAKTGAQIPDKVVERLIKRQTGQIQQVSSMRLKYIKLKQMVQEKLDAIDSLDVLENNLRLADYEQLKCDNRNHADKIEEKDEELARLRNKCQNTIQILAHMREKTNALDSDLSDLQEDFYYADNTYKDFRENLANKKRSKDKYRHMVREAKEQLGLLDTPDLLRDMELSQNEIVRLEEELGKCHKDVEKKQENVRKLRKRIEELTEEVHRKKLVARKMKSEDKSKGSEIYNRRPTLYKPIIRQSEFDELVYVRPSPKISSKRK